MATQPLDSAVVESLADGNWDYSVFSIHARHNDLLEAGLKERGKQGWELVFMHMPVPFEYLCIFKRPSR